MADDTIKEGAFQKYRERVDHMQKHCECWSDGWDAARAHDEAVQAHDEDLGVALCPCVHCYAKRVAAPHEEDVAELQAEAKKHALLLSKLRPLVQDIFEAGETDAEWEQVYNAMAECGLRTHADGKKLAEELRAQGRWEESRTAYHHQDPKIDGLEERDLEKLKARLHALGLDVSTPREAFRDHPDDGASLIMFDPGNIGARKLQPDHPWHAVTNSGMATMGLLVICCADGCCAVPMAYYNTLDDHGDTIDPKSWRTAA